MSATVAVSTTGWLANAGQHLKIRVVRLFGVGSSVAELFAVSPCLIWAIVLFAPGCTFCWAPAYARMRFMGEGYWALIFAALTFMSVCSWWLQIYIVRKAAMLALVMWWLFIARSMALSYPSGVVGYLHLLYAAAAALAYLQLGRDDP